MVAKLLTIQFVCLSAELAHFASRECIDRLLAMEREIAPIQLTCIKLELIGVENGPFNLESRSIRGQLKTPWRVNYEMSWGVQLCPISPVMLPSPTDSRDSHQALPASAKLASDTPKHLDVILPVSLRQATHSIDCTFCISTSDACPHWLQVNPNLRLDLTGHACAPNLFRCKWNLLFQG